MKNYQKPMVNVEMINVEDVITASAVTPADQISTSSAMSGYLGGTTGASEGGNSTIVFEW